MKKLLIAMILAMVFIPDVLADTSNSSSALPLPFIEDFSDVPIGQIPAGWTAISANWRVQNSSFAGGIQPEIGFRIDEQINRPIKLITPKLDASSSSNILLVFKYSSFTYLGDHTLRVETSTDDGATWQIQWSTQLDTSKEEVFINLDDLSGKEFIVAFVWTESVGGFSSYWFIDDLYISETQKLDLLTPVGQGAISPGTGSLDLPLDYKIVLAASPSSTWYAFNLSSSKNCSIAFDPTCPNDFSIIGPNHLKVPVKGGTWADGMWYVVDRAYPRLLTVDIEDGTMSKIGLSDGGITDLAYDDVNDILYGISMRHLSIIDRSNGDVTHIGDLLSFFHRNLAYGNGELYSTDFLLNAIYTMDVKTAKTTKTLKLGFPAYIFSGSSMEYDKDHDRLILISETKITQDILTIAEIDLVKGRAIYYSYFEPDGEQLSIAGLAIPYGRNHRWEFDHWEVDGDFYSFDRLTSLTMDAEHTAQAFFTEYYPLTVQLEMPEMVHPDEEFSIVGHINNSGPPLSNVPLFFILEIYGKFWFWPSWTLFDNLEHAEIDFEFIDLPSGTTSIDIVPLFIWPDTGHDAAVGLGLYGAILNPKMDKIRSNLAFKEWGYGPSR